MTDLSERGRNHPRYPLDQAFVVHIAWSPSEGQPQLSGRVEHVSSGKVLEFADSAALLGFIDGFIAATKDPA